MGAEGLARRTCRFPDCKPGNPEAWWMGRSRPSYWTGPISCSQLKHLEPARLSILHACFLRHQALHVHVPNCSQPFPASTVYRVGGRLGVVVVVCTPLGLFMLHT